MLVWSHNKLAQPAMLCEMHDLGTFFGQSGKLKSKFKAIVAAEAEGPAVSIRPLSPTRWTDHSPATPAVLSQYGMVLNVLDEMAANHSESEIQPEGLRVRLQQGNVILGLLLAVDVIGELEVLNVSLQACCLQSPLSKTA